MMVRNLGRRCDLGIDSGAWEYKKRYQACQEMGIPSFFNLLGSFILYSHHSVVVSLASRPSFVFNCVDTSFILLPWWTNTSQYLLAQIFQRLVQTSNFSRKDKFIMQSPSGLLAVAAFLPAVLAHYNFEALIVNGNVTSPYEYVRQTNNSNSPITDITSTNMRCNSGGLLAATMAQTSTYTVAPGDNVGFTIDAAISHPGPLSVWMSKAPDGTTAQDYDGSGDWFKIYELTTYDITSAGLQWATYIPGTSGIQNFTVDIPTDLPAGEYLLRGEHIALHAAEEFEGAQYYIGCAQLSVTGSGSGSPSPLTTIPGEYTGYEAGLIIDIYYPIPTNYTAPGISTWPEACISHWPNLVDQTYYGMCYNSKYTDCTAKNHFLPLVY